jgi:hypothetical protein
LIKVSVDFGDSRSARSTRWNEFTGADFGFQEQRLRRHRTTESIECPASIMQQSGQQFARNYAPQGNIGKPRVDHFG